MDSGTAKILGAAAMATFLLLVELICVKVGWSMFVTPVFKLAELDWTQAMGFTLLASMFRTSVSSIVSNKDAK